MGRGLAGEASEGRGCRRPLTNGRNYQTSGPHVWTVRGKLRMKEQLQEIVVSVMGAIVFGLGAGLVAVVVIALVLIVMGINKRGKWW